jgi:ariadne-1
VTSREKDYEILDHKQLEQREEAEISNVVDTLGLSTATARVLLRSYGWNSEKIMNMFLDRGKEYVLKQAGLTEEDIIENEQEQGDEEFSCPACCDDVKLSESTMLAACKHRFCNTCWKTYIQLKINEGQATRITCMGFKCPQALDETFVSKFVDKKNSEKYQEKVLASFVEDNPFVKWCPSVPSCQNAVLIKLTPNVCYTH